MITRDQIPVEAAQAARVAFHRAEQPTALECFKDALAAALSGWPGAQHGWNDREDNPVTCVPLLHKQNTSIPTVTIVDGKLSPLIIGSMQASYTLEPYISDGDDDATFVAKMDKLERSYPIEFHPERNEIKDYDRLIGLARAAIAHGLPPIK